MSERNNNPSFLIGVAIGAAITYLFTTKNGQRIRGQLIKEGTKLLDRIGENLQEAESNVQETANRIEKKAAAEIEKAKENLAEKVEDSVSSLEVNSESIKEEIKENLSDIPKEVREIQKKGRRFFFHRSHNHES